MAGSRSPFARRRKSDDVWLDSWRRRSLYLVLTTDDTDRAPTPLYPRGDRGDAADWHDGLHPHRPLPSVRRVLHDTHHPDDGGVWRNSPALARGPRFQFVSH